jgi:hypothetical protein
MHQPPGIRASPLYGERYLLPAVIQDADMYLIEKRFELQQQRTFFLALVLTVEEKEVELAGTREKHKNIFFRFGIPHLCHN